MKNIVWVILEKDISDFMEQPANLFRTRKYTYNILKFGDLVGLNNIGYIIKSKKDHIGYFIKKGKKLTFKKRHILFAKLHIKNCGVNYDSRP